MLLQTTLIERNLIAVNFNYTSVYSLHIHFVPLLCSVFEVFLLHVLFLQTQMPAGDLEGGTVVNCDRIVNPQFKKDERILCPL